MNKRIVAIDFETTNKHDASACSIGYAVIENRKIIENDSILLKPHVDTGEFLPQNIRIHHITPSMVKDAPEFDTVYKNKLAKVFEGSVLVAHNAIFDMKVLKSLSCIYNLQIPAYNFFCTVDLSKNVWENLFNHKLPTVADAVNYRLKNHHDACYDAYACAKIVTSAMKDLDTDSMEGLCFLGKVKIGTILNTDLKNWCMYNHYSPKLLDLQKLTMCGYSKHPFYNKNIAEIGLSKQFSKEIIAQHLININSNFHEYILKDTDVVILADKYIGNRLLSKPVKEKLSMAKLRNIRVISETKFKEILFSHGYLDNRTGFPKYKTNEY